MTNGTVLNLPTTLAALQSHRRRQRSSTRRFPRIEVLRLVNTHMVACSVDRSKLVLAPRSAGRETSLQLC